MSPEARPATRLRNSRGFTLIEVMLAMLITAFIAILAYNGLSAAISAEETNSRQIQRLADIQLPLTVMERDIRHAVNRAVVDEYGDPVPAMSGGELYDYLLRLTRSGWANPRGLPRGGLQRVRYQLQDGELWRESWSVLDRQTEEAGQQRTLLMEHVNRIRLAFLNPKSSGAGVSKLGGEWVDEWEGDGGLPLAVELRIEVEGFGELRRVFSIPGN